MQLPVSPATQRLRNIRRRVTAGVLATFVAAWLAVAALGKGGGTSSATTTPSAAGSSSSTQTDDLGTGATQSDTGSTQTDSGSSASSSHDSQPAPVTSSQS